MWRLCLLALVAVADDSADITDSETSRKVLGSSVVTSVSVIMDAGNGSKIYSDAVGKPVSKPLVAGDLASPINLLTPDRYEFYTFDDSGDLVKRLMTLEEIQDIIATGDGDGFNIDMFTSSGGFMPEKRVNDVVHNVQNVLKEEMKVHKDPTSTTQFDTPDVSDSWTQILPAFFGNSGQDIKAEAAAVHVTPDTIMIEPDTLAVSSTKQQISTTEKVTTLQSTVRTTTQSTTTKTPLINVEIYVNSNSTTEKPKDSIESESSQIIEIKPIVNDVELTKDNTIPIFHIDSNRKPTKKPIKPTTFRPTRSTTTKKPTSTTAVPEMVNDDTITPITQVAKQTTPTTTEIPTSTTSRTTVGRSTTTPRATAPPSTTTPRTTASPSTTTLRDVTPEASTTILEKVAPPQTTTTTTQSPSTTTVPSTTQASTTTQVPTTTVTTSQAPTTQPPSTTQPPTTAKLTTTTEPPTTTALPLETTTELFTTEKDTVLSTTILSTTPEVETETVKLPTLLEVLTNYQDSSTVTTTEKRSPESSTVSLPSTFGSLSTFFIVSNNRIKTETTTQQDDSTPIDLSTLSTEYVLISANKSTPVDTTTDLPITERSTTQLLDQYLLTSTNIYEINSELSDKNTTIADLENTTNEGTTTEIQMVKLKEATTTTTDQTFVESIEQLLSQAVGTPEPPVDNAKEASKVQEMIANSFNKTMPQILSETATLASDLIGFNQEITTTTEQQGTFNDTDLSESVGALLSQIYETGSTTIEDDVTSTTIIPETTTIVKSTESPKDNGPHIINITIIRNENRKNQTKPAKADLSLEMEYEEIINEIRKNSSLTSTQKPSTTTEDEILITQAASSMSNDEVVEEITTTVVNDEDGDNSTETTTMSGTESTIFVTEPMSTTTELPISTNKSTTKPFGVNTTNSWTLVSTLAPHSESTTIVAPSESPIHAISSLIDPPAPVDLVAKPLQGFGLEDSTAKLGSDVYQFVQLCNELAFGFWRSVTTGISSARSVFVSPFAATSMLAMVFLGARGVTSNEMNTVLKLDDMETFNPHMIFKNVSESIETTPESGVAVSAIIRELYSDRSKGPLLDYYKARVRFFYDGLVEEVGFREIGDVIRRRTNLLVKKSTNGKIGEFLKDGHIMPKPPMAGISVSIFETDCSEASSEGRDGELHFVVLPSIRQRRLIPIPATVYRSGFLAGYEPSLDATAAALGTKDHTISTIFIIPGQQGVAAPGDGLARLEKRLVESFSKGAWARLLRSLIPRPGVELQLPRFLHRSVINATQSLRKMGLYELFDSHKANLQGLNSAAHELHLSDVLQVNEFATCGEDRIGEGHHKEVYPAAAGRRSRQSVDFQRAFHDPLHDPTDFNVPLSLRPRQARLPETPRLRFDRPFLYVVRHNPSGLILHMGRFHPRLLP